MTLLDKILYLADYIEETLILPGSKKQGARQAQPGPRCFTATTKMLTELIARGKLIHSDTIGAYNDMIYHGIRWRELTGVNWRQESFETFWRKRRPQR